MKKKLPFFTLLALLFILNSCEDYLGKKTDLDFIDVPPDNTVRDIAYVPIFPVLDNFSRPVDITTGFDEILYIADEAAGEVIAMDEAGNILASKAIPGAKAVVQDRRFDLLVIGTKDTLINTGDTDTLLTLSAIYRLRMVGNGYNLSNAQIVNTIVHPFYYTQNNPIDKTIEQVSFQDIAIIGNNQDPSQNNQFYVTRRGEGSSGPLGPNDAVLYFNNQDEFTTPISVQTSAGFFNDYFQDPSGIFTLTQPPQLSAQGGRDFVYTSLDPSNALKLQYIEFIEGEFGAEYRPRILASSDTSQANGFINSPNKFGRPLDATLAGDGSQFIFVVDTETDSLYQFSFTGFEGVLPPPAANIDRYQKASFGGTGSGPTQFRDPRAVAYFKNIVYVADAGNGRILRFKLTLDFD
jgi:hypothetical protein